VRQTTSGAGSKITFSPLFWYETARPSQKKRYRTVAQLAPDHL